jgi:pimeloyl-ACP methyl ester carboxylesterase
VVTPSVPALEPPRRRETPTFRPDPDQPDITTSHDNRRPDRTTRPGHARAALRSFIPSDVVLTGHSYSGIVVTGAADRAADRVGLVVYIDAEIPEDGQSMLDMVPEVGEIVRSAADERGHGWIPVLDEVLPPEGLIDEEKRSRYVARLRPQPVATFTESVRLSGAIGRIPRAFVHCTGGNVDLGSGDPIEAHAARAKAEGWTYRELSTPHDPQLFDPGATADALDELATDRVK